jgi:ribonuclease J
VGDIGDVALRDRRHMAADGVLIIVATLASQNGTRSAAAELIARGFAETGPLLDEMRAEAESVLRDLLAQDVIEIKLLQEHLHDGVAQLVYDRTTRRPMILPVVVEV